MLPYHCSHSPIAWKPTYLFQPKPWSFSKPKQVVLMPKPQHVTIPHHYSRVHCYYDDEHQLTTSANVTTLFPWQQTSPDFIHSCMSKHNNKAKQKNLQEECIFESMGLRAIALFKIRSCRTNELFDKFCPRGHFFLLLGFWNNRLLERWEVPDSISLDDHSLTNYCNQPNSGLFHRGSIYICLFKWLIYS